MCFREAGSSIQGMISQAKKYLFHRLWEISLFARDTHPFEGGKI